MTGTEIVPLPEPGDLDALPLPKAFDLVDQIVTVSEVARAWRDQKISDLHAEGLNDREIGEMVGRDSDTIGHHRRRLGLPPNDRRGGARLPHDSAKPGPAEQEAGALSPVELIPEIDDGVVDAEVVGVADEATARAAARLRAQNEHRARSIETALGILWAYAQTPAKPDAVMDLLLVCDRNNFARVVTVVNNLIESGQWDPR